MSRPFVIIFPKNFIEDEYINKEKSVPQIAEENNVTKHCIRSHIDYFQIPMRTKKEAQRIAMASGRNHSPTTGRMRTLEEKVNISMAASKRYWERSAEDRARLNEKKKNNFKCMSEESKKKFYENSKKALIQSQKRGSKFETFCAELLRARGYRVETQRQCIIRNETMKIDLFLPDNNIAIEIDGPTHFKKVYNDGSFEKKREADARKNTLLVAEGYRIIRLGVERANSMTVKNAYFMELMHCIETIYHQENKVIYAGDYRKIIGE